MDKKTLIDKILSATRLSLEINASSLRESCGRYSHDDFDSYWDGLLTNKESMTLESHCLDCLFCLHGLDRARKVHKKTEEISDRMKDDDLVHAANDLIERNNARREQEYLWAATENHPGGHGEAFGVVVADKGEIAAMLECEAWVGKHQDKNGSLDLVGRQVEGARSGEAVTPPFDWLEERLEDIFRVNPVLHAFHLDKRLINVHFDERIFKEVNSLSLAIVMAIINAIHQRKDDKSVAYSADLRQDGKLEMVGQIPQKLKAASDHGIKQIILSKENQPDCPAEFLSDPNFQVLFFDNLKDLLDYLDLVPINRSKQSRIHDNRTNRSTEKRDHAQGKLFSLSASTMSKEWDFIVQKAGEQGVDKAFLEQLLSYFEDLCQARPVEGSFNAVIFMGSPDKIHTFLPPSGIEFVRKQPILETPESLLSLAPLVNGKELGFVLSQNGGLDSIRRVNVDIIGRQDISPLIMGVNHRYACLSLLSESLVFFFPPTGRHLNVFLKGELIGKYLNGRWRKTDYGIMQRLLRQASDHARLNWTALKKTTRAAVTMAERGQGGIFVFVRDAKDVAHKFVNRLESYWGLRLGDISCDELTEKELINLARNEGGVILDRSGNLIACRAYFSTETSQTKEWRPGLSLRHQHARRFSKMVGGLALVASRYGMVTVYEKGEKLISV